MAKSIIITYNEADENLLMALFKKFKIKTERYSQQQTTPSTEKTKEDIKNDLRQAVSEMHAHARGDISLPTWYDMMSELEHNEEVQV